MSAEFRNAWRAGLLTVVAVAGAVSIEARFRTMPGALAAGPAGAQRSASVAQRSVPGAQRSVPGVTLSAVRAATAKYQNIDAAFDDGYIDDGFGCIDAPMFGLDPSEGAMGFHLINWSLHDDPANDPLRPDLLVYEPARGNGKPKLVALEYEVFRPDWYAAGNTEPPSLFGREFESFEFDGLEIFGLHLWLWRENPSGLFADFNPKVRCR